MTLTASMTPDEFLRRLKELLEGEAQIAFFLGAGASISSGIPGAAALARTWLVQMHHLETGQDQGLDEWVSKTFPSFDSRDPAASYADVMQRRFPTHAERQLAIERIVLGRDPGFGYATLAQLMTAAASGPRCNVVLTTNFDDLVADALYLYTRQKPLVVTHEALASYVTIGRTRPTVIKLHGDALLDPKSTADETRALPIPFKSAIERVLRSRGLVFIGYGGNDEGVLDALEHMPNDTFDWGLYWVSDSLPNNPFGQWLSARGAVWVQHLGFDELMVTAKVLFGLPTPDGSRFEALLATYRETFAPLQERPPHPERASRSVDEAVARVTLDFGWFTYELQARQYARSDPHQAQAIYIEGITRYPVEPNLLGNYANFLADILGDSDRAEEFYRRAIDADPNHANSLGNYAVFLTKVRGNSDRAEEFHRRAIDADPNHANNLANYAVFLTKVRGNSDRAEEFFRRAIDADPDNPNLLVNYAQLLFVVGRSDEARQLLDAAAALEPNDPALNLEIWFYRFAHVPTDREQSLCEVVTRLRRGDRSPGWDLSPNAQKALEAGHPDAALVEALAAAIVGADSPDTVEMLLGDRCLPGPPLPGD